MLKETKPENAIAVYQDAQDEMHEQCLADIVTQGTLIDPETGDDMPIVAIRAGVDMSFEVDDKLDVHLELGGVTVIAPNAPRFARWVQEFVHGSRQRSQHRSGLFELRREGHGVFLTVSVASVRHGTSVEVTTPDVSEFLLSIVRDAKERGWL